MVANTDGEKFGEAFFFSAQTFTTVGYGRINPTGFIASFVASMEALTGLMSFALVTGLLYGRFARPRAFIKYSKKCAICSISRWYCPYVFGWCHTQKNYLMNVEVKSDDGITDRRRWTT